MNEVDRARRYLARIPSAVSGAGGHSATYRAACRLREFGLSFDDALTVLMEWNATHCSPAWSEGELRHKLIDAFKNSRPRAAYIQRDGKRPPVTVTPRSPQSSGVSRHNGKSALPRIPAVHAATPADVAALVKIRGVSEAAIQLASDLGLLRFGEFMGRDAWFILDRSGRIAQARRLDGKEWYSGVKAWSLKRSQTKWPVGILESAKSPSIALVEGGGDLLAICHLIAAAGRTDVVPVSILGSRMNIHEDALRHFGGKRVRVFAQNDAAGRAADLRWTQQIRPHAALVDSINIGDFYRGSDTVPNDWNEFVRSDTPTTETASTLLETL